MDSKEQAQPISVSTKSTQAESQRYSDHRPEETTKGATLWPYVSFNRLSRTVASINPHLAQLTCLMTLAVLPSTSEDEGDFWVRAKFEIGAEENFAGLRVWEAPMRAVEEPVDSVVYGSFDCVVEV
jgi:hypothetical protein